MSNTVLAQINRELSLFKPNHTHQHQNQNPNTMSPFSQLMPSAFNTGYGQGIDHDFSPVLNYIDEFDRHFSRRHRFVNCFIPRFDLEEDAVNYYLYGDIPGAGVEDIVVEARDLHTLVIHGTTRRVGLEGADAGQAGEVQPVPVEVKDGQLEHGSGSVATEKAREDAGVTTTFPPPPTQANIPQNNAPHPSGHNHLPMHPAHSQSQSQNQSQNQTQAQAQVPAPGPHRSSYAQYQAQFNQPTKRTLLSERLTGDFTRTFTFPEQIREEDVKASVENGVLTLVVPKKGGESVVRGRRIEVQSGRRS